MDDRNIMENLLQTSKGACELYMHGAIEASDPQVRSAFCAALNDELNMQSELYGDMSARGWYGSEQAPGAQISKVQQKFCC